MHHVPCTMHHAPCTMCHAPCAMHHVPCAMHHALCAMHHLPCTIYRAPCAMHHAPCTMCHAPCTTHHVPCTKHHAPCTMHPFITCTILHGRCVRAVRSVHDITIYGKCVDEILLYMVGVSEQSDLHWDDSRRAWQCLEHHAMPHPRSSH